MKVHELPPSVRRPERISKFKIKTPGSWISDRRWRTRRRLDRFEPGQSFRVGNVAGRIGQIPGDPIGEDNIFIAYQSNTALDPGGNCRINRPTEEHRRIETLAD